MRAVGATLKRLPPNPRQIKRFDNAFRLQLYVATGGGSTKLAFDEPKLRALGKWVVLRLRWPALAGEIEDDQNILMFLEELANGEPPVIDEDSDPRFLRVVNDWRDHEALHDLLRDDDAASWVSQLPLDEFIQIT